MERKHLIPAILIGAILAELLVVWLAPKYILWYFEPPVAMGFSCQEPIGWALARLQRAQLLGLILGAVVGFGIWAAARVRKNRQAPLR